MVGVGLGADAASDSGGVVAGVDSIVGSGSGSGRTSVSGLGVGSGSGAVSEGGSTTRTGVSVSLGGVSAGSGSGSGSLGTMIPAGSGSGVDSLSGGVAAGSAVGRSDVVLSAGETVVKRVFDSVIVTDREGEGANVAVFPDSVRILSLPFAKMDAPRRAIKIKRMYCFLTIFYFRFLFIVSQKTPFFKAERLESVSFYSDPQIVSKWSVGQLFFQILLFQ